MKYMLDTNICIYIIRRKPKDVVGKFANLVQAFLQEYRAAGSLSSPM